MSKDKHRGKQRRNALLWRAIAHGGIGVNCKWQPQTGKSPDLDRLIKKGLLRLQRNPTTGRKRSRKRQTYAVVSGDWLRHI